MRSFSVRPARLILVPSTLQSHALVPFRPTSSSSAHPVTYPFTFPSHIIPISPSSHIPFYLSVPHHPHQPIQSHALLPFRLTSSPSVLQSHTLLPFRPTSSPSTPPFPRPFTFPSHILPVSPPVTYPFTFPFHVIPVSPSSHIPFYLFISFNISSHLCVFSPLVLDPRGKCREFPRKRFTFPRGRQGHRLHMPLSPHLQSLPPGKVPGFPAKTVHFPPWHEASVYRHSEKEHLLDLG